MNPIDRRLSRRTVLGVAATGAVSAAGLGLIAPRFGGSRPLAAKPNPIAPPTAPVTTGSWPSPLSDPRARAAHLLRRAGFAPTATELDAAVRLSYKDLVDAVVNQKAQPLPQPRDLGDHAAVVTAWYQHMATTSAPFPERMLLFWHGVLTSDYRKANGRPYVWQQNVTYRDHGLGDLRSLLLAATYDPLMMDYLDLSLSSGKAPNENYARELMELFTLGVGNYTEDDVRQGAKALSGIRVVAVDSAGRTVPMPKRTGKTPSERKAYDHQLAAMAQQGIRFVGRVEPRLHSKDSVTFLGRTGDLTPEQVVDAILAKDACATFIARRALTAFALPQPSDAYVARVAAAFRNSGYDIRTLMRTIFLSDEFHSADAYRALVRSPADCMVATMRVLGRPDLAATAVKAGPGMDQVLYNPPNVAGWPTNTGWISSSSVLARVNFAETVVGKGGRLPDPATAAATHLDGVLGSDTARVLAAATTSADRWYAVLASPEFHLK